MRILYPLLFASLACAAGGIDTPTAGYARGSAGSIIRVSGVSGAFITTGTDQSGVRSAAFSDRLGLVKSDSTVRVLDAAGNVVNESDAPEGDALFGFDPSGGMAVAWYASSQTLMVYREGRWSRAPVDASSGTVMAVAAKDQDTALAIFQGDSLSIARIRLADGAVEDRTSVGSGSGPVLLFGDGSLLFERDGSTVYRNAAGEERTLETPGEVVEFMPMSAGWTQLRTASGRSLALRLSPEPRLYDLPEVSQ